MKDNKLYWVGSYEEYHSRNSACETEGEHYTIKGYCVTDYKEDPYGESETYTIRCAPGSIVYFSEVTDCPHEFVQKENVCQVDKKGKVTCTSVKREIEYFPNGRIDRVFYQPNGPKELTTFPPSKVDIAKALVKYDPDFVLESIYLIGRFKIREYEDYAEMERGAGDAISFFGDEQQAVESFDLADEMEEKADKAAKELDQALRRANKLIRKTPPQLRKNTW